MARSRLRKSPKGSLLFSFKLSIGIVAFAGIDLFTNEAIATFVASPGVRTDFLYYAAPVYITENADTNIYGAKLLNQELIKNAVIVCPSVEEQRAIADFLDRETAKIDALIAKKERLIELLEEKRAALITHAVTRGLNSDAPLRDSGIKWLGQIPKHWALRRLKRLAKRIQTGSTPPTADQSYYQTEEVPWFGPGSFGRAFTLTNPTKLISESAIADGVARRFKAGSTLIVTIGATIGKVGYLDRDASSNQQITAISYDEAKIETKFAAHQLKSFEPAIRGMAPTTTLPIMDQNEVGMLWLAVPPVDEQRRIEQHIERSTLAIDQLIVKVNEAIERLVEYRSSLITAAVTGQIDVRDEVKAAA